MNIIYSIIYGIVEGITEWLPISSTGHLILFNSFMQFKDLSKEFWNMFEVVIQFGAILAVIVIYFNKIFPFKINANKKVIFKRDIFNLWGKIIVSCLPAIVIVGLKLDDKAEKYLYNPFVISIMLILVGIAFIIIENKKEGKSKINEIVEITYKNAVLLGLFQIIAAIFPGTSRSGIIIIGALLLGISREIATEYAFYLAIPAMAGASLIKLMKFGINFTYMELIVLLVGMITAFLVSIGVIKLLINYIKKRGFKVFGIYRIILGIIVLTLFLTNLI